MDYDASILKPVPNSRIGEREGGRRLISSLEKELQILYLTEVMSHPTGKNSITS